MSVRVCINVPEFSRFLFFEFDDPANGLLGLAGHSERVHDEIQFARHTQHERERVKGQSVGVLEERQPLDAILLPLFGDTVRMQQLVNVAVPVRFGLNLVPLVLGFQSDASVIVQDSWDTLSLLNNRNLIWTHAKVIVLSQQLNGASVRITRRHNAQWKFASCRSIFFLNGKDILNIKLQVASLACHFCR